MSTCLWRASLPRSRVAYSAGTRLVIEAVSMLAMAGGAEARNSVLGEIILVGSDYARVCSLRHSATVCSMWPSA